MDMQGCEPHTFIVLGGAGDLMRRKLLPARYHLLERSGDPHHCHLLAVARSTDRNDDTFRAWARQALQDANLLDGGEGSVWCDNCLHYHALGHDAGVDDYRALGKRVRDIEKEHDLPGNRIFYLAVPPSAVGDTIEALGEVGLCDAPGWCRVVVEKPFGYDLDSARNLNRVLHRYWDESQIFRIDHYLGKETVQNLLVFRFSNPIFESVWNRDRVHSVHITVAESEGVGTRGEFYEQAGAIRDMVQNHLTQLLTLTAMEVPAAFDAEAIRDEKAKVLRCIPPFTKRDVVLGQYTSGTVDGEQVAAYCDEPGVPDDSNTETFAALRAYVANWRWQGVPFYIRTGKRMARRTTEIVIAFRCPPTSIFAPHASCKLHANALVITLQPDEGFDLSFEVKAPDETFAVETQKLHFRYSEAFGRLPDAYETLLQEVIAGDPALFVRADETELAWKLYGPLLERDLPVHPYPAGSWGPDEVKKLVDAPAMAGMPL